MRNYSLAMLLPIWWICAVEVTPVKRITVWCIEERLDSQRVVSGFVPCCYPSWYSRVVVHLGLDTRPTSRFVNCIDTIRRGPANHSRKHDQWGSKFKQTSSDGINFRCNSNKYYIIKCFSLWLFKRRKWLWFTSKTLKLNN